MWDIIVYYLFILQYVISVVDHWICLLIDMRIALREG